MSTWPPGKEAADDDEPLRARLEPEATLVAPRNVVKIGLVRRVIIRRSWHEEISYELPGVLRGIALGLEALLQFGGGRATNRQSAGRATRYASRSLDRRGSPISSRTSERA